ncbi:MAG TPA: Ig-like domain-containing protein [Thermoanaerobaculia bacterium]|nr:Ig-like domain-containing protein [Thermoanaerobaculia bacterium]
MSADGSGAKNNDLRGRTVGNTSEGGPSTYASASHGGVGGETNTGVTNAVYGSITNPTHLGTGGGGGVNSGNAGGSGGGAIRIAAGVISVAGAIRADGASRSGDGNAGSGGSIVLDAAQFITAPLARITANGGDDDGTNNASRGAGGGRIAVLAGQRFDVETVGLQLQSRGGRNDTTGNAASYLDGGSGTIYLRRPGQTLGELVVSAIDERVASNLHLTRPTPLSGTLRFDRMILGPRALVRADSALEVNGVVDDRTAVTIDATAALVLRNDVPAIQLTTTPAAGGNVVQGGTLVTTYTATSIAGIGAVTLAWSPVTPNRVDSYVSYPASASPSSAIQFSVPNDATIGAATLTVSASDRAGRSAQLAPATFNLIANAAPVIDLFDPQPASIYPGQKVTTTVSAHDDLKVTKITFTSTIGTGTPAPQVFTPTTQPVVGKTFDVTVPIATPGGQPLTLDLTVEDGFPSRPPATQQKVVTILRDTVVPAVAITSPAANTLFNEGTGNTITIRATAADAEVGVKDVTAQIGDGVPVTLAKSGNEYVATVPVPPVDGTDVVTLALTVTAKDYEGNAGTRSIDIRIQPVNDPNAPAVSWACTTPGMLYPAGYTAKLRVYAIGNTVGNAANGIQKVEMFVNDSTTPIAAAAVGGLANHYEAAFAIPSDAAPDTAFTVRAVATNVAGLSESIGTSFAVVAGTAITADTTISATDTTYDNKTVIVRGGTTTILGNHTFERLLVLDGAKVTHPATDLTTVHRLAFTATAGVFVSCTGSIDASARGITGSASGTAYTYDRATGAPTLTGGAGVNSAGSHGGEGGAGTGNLPAAFGSIFDPNTPGGAGAGPSGTTCNPCRSGGGVIRVAAPIVHVDGTILANGQAASAAGAGGSIRIDADTLRGGGEIHADGGTNTSGASGGGGRIAIYSKTSTIPAAKITAAALAAQTTAATGAPGTIYHRRLDAGGAKLSDEIVVDNLARATTRGTALVTAGSGTVVSVSGSDVTLSSAVPFDVEGTWIDFVDANGEILASHAITARTATSVTLAGSVSVAAGTAYRGVIRADRITSRGSAIVDASALAAPSLAGGTSGVIRTPLLHSADDVILENSAVVEVSGKVAAANLTLRNGATLTHPRATATTIHRLTVDVASTLAIDATSAIDVTARGLTGVTAGVGYTYDGTTGKPALTGGSANSSGGSHGGSGGVWSGNEAATYGSVFNPTTPGGAGSAGTGTTCSPCRSGGGVVQIVASRLQLDGKILANGESADSGGAGGSIRIDAATLEGSGEIHADGGVSTGVASGGGGRIALYYGTNAIPETKITALAPQAQNANAVGAPGTIFLRSDAQTYGSLTIDNGSRTTTRNTRLSAVGYSAVTEVGADFLRDANAQYPAQSQLEGVRAVVRYDRARALPIVSNDATTLRVSGSPAFAVAGDALRGLYRFDTLRLRNARLDTIDLFEAATTDKDAASVILGNNQAPPAVDMARIVLQNTATGAAVIGTAGAVLDTDTPVAVNAKNMRTGNIYNVNAGADGSFAIPVQGEAGDAFTLWARDASFYPLSSAVYNAGTLTQSTPVPSQINRSEWTTDTNFYPRTLSRDGAHLAVASYPTTNGSNDKLVVLSVADPAHPSFARTVSSGVGAVRDVVVYGGWAYVAADRLYTLDLTNPSATPNYPGDVCGSDFAVALSGGFAFTTEGNCYNDGRIIVYDVANPATPRLIRHEPVAGAGGVIFTDLHALGSDYLVALSGNRPGNIGYDVVVIDRRDLSNLVKVATLDVPSFDAFRGTLVDTKLYLVSRTSSQVVIVDLANPAAPVVIGTASIPAGAGGAAVVGRDAFAAAGASGLATLDVTNPASPFLTGTTAIGGTAFDVTVIGAYAYVANETGVALVPAQVAPQVIVPRIAMSLDGTLVTVTGQPQSVLGAAPIRVALTNTATNATVSGITVAGDGSFNGTLPASPGDRITITATDSFNRATGPLGIGMVPFGRTNTALVITQAMSDSNFYTRNVATAGNHLVATSYPTDNGSSDKVVIFDIANRAAPVHRRTISSGVGAVRDVAIAGDWAYIVADRLFTLNLAGTTSTPSYPADVCGSDIALEVVNGFAFAAEANCYNDGRIIIYDISTPSTPRLLRHESVSGVGGFYFTGLSALGTDYLVGVSSLAPGGVGRDVTIIDRRDVNDLKKVAELDIPSFSAFRVKAVGTTLYVSGGSGGLAVVDASNPAAPALVGIVRTPGYPRSVDAIGAMLAVADGSAGATFVDIGSAGLPPILGNQPTGGNAWECALNADTLYIANEQGIAVIDGLGTPPLIDRALISTASNGAGLVTVTGAANSILGLAPLQLQVRNATTGASVNLTVNANGSFNTTLDGVSGEALTVRATDSIGRVAGPLTIGTVPFGASIQHVTITPAMSDSSFLARNVAANGAHAVVTSYPTDIGSSDKIVIFDITTPGQPQYVRTVSSGVGAVRDVRIVNGRAIIAADRTFTLDLTTPGATPVYPSDVCGSDIAIELAGGYVFAAEANCYNDGRIIVYEMSTLGAPRMIRHDGIAGVGGIYFTDLTALGTNYLVGVSPHRPGGIGRDVVVIDRRDINNLRKVAELDIPNFDAFRARAIGSMLYVTGVNAGVAVVDLSNPASPRHVLTESSPGAARGIDVAGNTLAVANGSNGVSFMDTTNPNAPFIEGAQPVQGSAWEVALARGAMYVAAELGLTAVAQLGAPPMIDDTVIAVTPATSSTTVTGAAFSISGIAPIVVQLVNDVTAAVSAPAPVAANGSFSATISATPGQRLTLRAIDAAGRMTVRALGSTYGTTATRLANPTVAGGDGNYRARRVNTDGTNIVVTTGSTWGASVPVADKLVVFPRPGAADQSVKVKSTGVGGLHDARVVNGFVYFVADRLAVLDLNDPALPIRYPGDVCGSEVAMTLSGSYAFAAEAGCYNDGRIVVYNISNPAAPVLVRHQGVAGVGGLSWRGMATLGTGFIVAISPDRPGGTGHDVAVIDITDINNLRKVADIDIPSFDALDGVIDGATLYLAGGDAGVAIVDLTNPLAPVVRSVIDTPGIARGIALGRANELIVADAGGPGIAFLDVTNKSAPAITGTQALTGNITDVDYNPATREIYVAGENYFHTIVRPQE